MERNRLRRLEDLGQSVWLDFIDHNLLESGELGRLIEEDGLSGVTSNPTIFQKAIAGSTDYDDVIASAEPSDTDAAVFERLMVRDLTLACDALRPVYDASGGRDGFASIEVSPSLAGDTDAQIEQASRFWRAVDRPNLMVKIPGTPAGVPAIEACLARGININITLLFSVPRYREVLEAYLCALEQRVAKGQPIDRVASVASFFVSRVDTKVDQALDGMDGAERDVARELRGTIAIANAKLAYEHYESVIESDRWRALADKGARPQRLLWASTSTKDPSYPDTYYLDALAGPDTVDTMTPASIRAYLDHGEPEARIAQDLEGARRQMEQLGEVGIDFAEVARELEEEGIASFAKSFNQAVASIQDKRAPRA